MDNFISTHNEVHGAQDSQRISAEISWIPRTSEVSQFLGAFAAYAPARVRARVHVCVSMCTLQWRECHEKAKNTFRINCRAGIPRRCVEQNATTLCSTYKRQENGKGRLVGRSVGCLVAWLVGRSVGRSGRRDARGYTRLVKMQTSRFGVDAGRERSRAGRCAIRCCRFACATSKKSDVDGENGKERKRDGKPARERAREGGRKKEARGKSDDGGKATL